jgi:TonB family protein
LLLHQLLLTGIESLIDFTTKPPEERHEVVLREDPEPEEKKTPVEEIPAPKQPEKRVRAPKPEPPKVRPRPTPNPAPKPVQEASPPETAAVEHHQHGVQEEMPLAEGPTPTPNVPVSPPNLNLNWKSFEKIYGAQAQADREAYAQAALEKRRGNGAFGNYSQRVMRAVRNNRSFIKPGQQEVLGAARQKLFHNYIEEIHQASIHPLFADSFLASLPSLSSSDPLNNWNLHMVAEFEIFESGQISEIRVVNSSGNMVFDAGAVDSIYRSSPFPKPPKQVLSWNGRVYLRWGFYRNHRKCGVFNVEPYILRAPGAKEEALPVDKFTVDDG